MRREAYFAAGGHAAIAESVLEDVALARRIKRRKAGLRFRYAPDALSTRMYRSFGQMYEGWTKNLALLFGNALALAAWRVIDLLVLLIGLPVIFLAFYQPMMLWWVLMALWARTLWRFYRRVARSNFPFSGLRFGDLWVAAVFVAAGAKLVSSHAQKAGSLEGKKLRQLTSVKRSAGLLHLID